MAQGLTRTVALVTGAATGIGGPRCRRRRCTAFCNWRGHQRQVRHLGAIVPAGGGPPPHVHSREEEGFYILEGEITFSVGQERFRGDGRDVPPICRSARSLVQE